MSRNEELALNVAVWTIGTIMAVGGSLLLFAALV